MTWVSDTDDGAHTGCPHGAQGLVGDLARHGDRDGAALPSAEVRGIPVEVRELGSSTVRWETRTADGRDRCGLSCGGVERDGRRSSAVLGGVGDFDTGGHGPAEVAKERDEIIAKMHTNISSIGVTTPASPCRRRARLPARVRVWWSLFFGGGLGDRGLVAGTRGEQSGGGAGDDDGDDPVGFAA